MSAISEISTVEPEPAAVVLPRARGRFEARGWKPALAIAVAVAVLVGLTLWLRPGPSGGGPGGSGPGATGGLALPALSLLQQAAAAESALFSGDQVVHVVNLIEVKPVDDPAWAKARWFPIMSLEANGKPRFHQLTLSAEVGKGYTVEDQAWYEPATSRSIRLLSVDGTPIYANSFDGQAVYFLDASAAPGKRVVKTPLADGFRAPDSPAEFLGIAAGLPSRLDEKDKTPALDVTRVKEITLDDGSRAQVLKVGYSRQDGPPAMPDAHHLFTIREDNHTIARMEFVADGVSLFVVRRVKTERVASPAVPWDLAGIDKRVAEKTEKPLPGILANMVVPNVSVEHMIEKAGFETYLFSSDPPWTTKREIADILDIPSPPNRAFAVAYRAEDGRHVVLWQAQSNKLVARKMTMAGKVTYTSPTGVKLWSIAMDKWLAGILLQSAQATTKTPPGAKRTGYMLETPDGTFPTLAINGALTDDELHALVDSLVPARECLEKHEP